MGWLPQVRNYRRNGEEFFLALWWEAEELEVMRGGHRGVELWSEGGV